MHGVFFHLGALLRHRKHHSTCFRIRPKARLFRCGFPIEPVDPGLQWEPCGKVLAALFPVSIDFGGRYVVVEVQSRPDKILDFSNRLV